MAFPKIYLNRDSLGKFIPTSYGILRAVMVLLFVTLIGYGISEVAVRINNWSYKYGIQKPYVILTGQGDVLFQLVKRPVIYKREPIQVLSPVASAMVEQTGPLSETEAKILKVFGERNFTVARAMAKCESGLRADAVNWGSHDVGLFQINWPTWEKPVKEKFGYTLKDMFDVDKNIEVAHWIFDRNNDGDGDVRPWVAVGTSCFRGEL